MRSEWHDGKIRTISLKQQNFANIFILLMNSSSRKLDPVAMIQPNKQLFHSGFQQRSWLKNHGKQDFIAFSDEALTQLRKYFNSLDIDKSGSIGVEQLEDPFIAFGLSDSREEVQQLIRCKHHHISAVDLDGSGQIEFDQFLEIMLKIKRGKSTGSKNSAMFDFFQKMSSGKLGTQFDKDMSFRLNVSQFRRRKLLESMMAENKEIKQKGSKILQNFKRQVVNHPGLKEALNESKKTSIYTYGLDIRERAKSKK